MQQHGVRQETDFGYANFFRGGRLLSCAGRTGSGIALPNPDTISLRAAIERALADSGIRAAAGRIAHEIGTMSSMHYAVGKIGRLSASWSRSVGCWCSVDVLLCSNNKLAIGSQRILHAVRSADLWVHGLDMERVCLRFGHFRQSIFKHVRIRSFSLTSPELSPSMPFVNGRRRVGYDAGFREWAGTGAAFTREKRSGFA